MRSRVQYLFMFIAFLGAVLAGGCDDDTLGRADGDEGAEYSADLRAMNTQVGNTVTGDASLAIDDNFLEVEINASGLAPSIEHAQHIHASGTCPPASADTNGDGYIDIVEGLPFYGAILISLDDNLSTQAMDNFPAANGSGQVAYSVVRDLVSIRSYLEGADTDPNDPFATLEGGEINLPARTVVLHGVASSTGLPATVQSMAGLPAHATLPVACGEIQ